MTQQNEPLTIDTQIAKYIAPNYSGAFSQCEIISNVSVPIIKLAANNVLQVETATFPFCMIMSQDCDLERDFEKYKKDKGTALRHILLCELEHSESKITQIAQSMRLSSKEGTIKERDLKTQLPTDPHQRHGFLEKLENHMPELLADFRMIYGLQPDFLYYQVEHKTCQRLTRLESPYKEYFSQRFYFYLNRVALPERHTSV